MKDVKFLSPFFYSKNMSEPESKAAVAELVAAQSAGVKMSRGGISAKLLQASMNQNRKKITSWELEFPRFIAAEFLTHRLFSRNGMSSRAVPIEKMISQVWNDPVIPVHWGKNQGGMQAKAELTGWRKGLAEFAWKTASKVACGFAWAFTKVGVHKQITNRMLEPWQRMKYVMTTTEMSNWLFLRNHADAQPEIKVVAALMQDVIHYTEAVVYEETLILNEGEAHLPYVGRVRDADNVLRYFVDTETEVVEVDLETAIMISSSCCAQVSYRLNDNSIDKALKVYKRLVESKPPHYSPFEHQAFPIGKGNVANLSPSWAKGITHMMKDGSLCSGNFVGWIQNRQLLMAKYNENCFG